MNMRKLKKQAYAVSPVIATLMLVLVSVGSAGAFYVWQNGWQKDVGDKAGSAELQSAITIGGSSTVYEFLVVAKEIFEASHPNYKIDIQKGGSGAGIAGAGMGLVDIGTASKDASGSFDTYPDLNRDGTKDLGIEMQQTLIGYDGVVVIVSASSSLALDNISEATMEGIYGKTITDWADVESGIGNATNATSTATPIKFVDRSDESGTEECFTAKLLSITGESYVNDKQIDLGWCTESFGSNQDLLNYIAANDDAIGFTAFGIANSRSDVKVIPFSKDGNDLSTGDGLPSASEIKSGAWPGSRPLNFLTVGDPTGDAKVFIDFCLATQANQEICQLSDYVSIYA